MSYLVHSSNEVAEIANKIDSQMLKGVLTDSILLLLSTEEYTVID